MALLNLSIFKKAHGVDELTAALAAFDADTEALQARQAELAGLIENALALAAVGEGETKGLKALQGEAAEITAKLTGRTGARAKIALELEAAKAEEERAARRAKVEAMRAWKKRADAAVDELAAAVRALSFATVAAQRAADAMPDTVNEMRPAASPPVRPLMTGFFRSLDRLAFADFGIDEHRFDGLIGALEGEKEYLDFLIGEIGDGAESWREHRRRVS